MDLTKTPGIDMDSLFKHRPMVETWTYGIGKDSWCGHRLIVLTTPKVSTLTHGIVSVLLNHTRTRGPSVTRMRDFFKESLNKRAVTPTLDLNEGNASTFAKF